MNLITMMVWLVSQPDILECKVKWALRSTAINKMVDSMKFQQNYSNP